MKCYTTDELLSFAKTAYAMAIFDTLKATGHENDEVVEKIARAVAEGAEATKRLMPLVHADTGGYDGKGNKA